MIPKAHITAWPTARHTTQTRHGRFRRGRACTAFGRAGVTCWRGVRGAGYLKPAGR